MEGPGSTVTFFLILYQMFARQSDIISISDRDEAGFSCYCCRGSERRVLRKNILVYEGLALWITNGFLYILRSVSVQIFYFFLFFFLDGVTYSLCVIRWHYSKERKWFLCVLLCLFSLISFTLWVGHLLGLRKFWNETKPRLHSLWSSRLLLPPTSLFIPSISRLKFLWDQKWCLSVFIMCLYLYLTFGLVGTLLELPTNQQILL